MEFYTFLNSYFASLFPLLLRHILQKPISPTRLFSLHHNHHHFLHLSFSRSTSLFRTFSSVQSINAWYDVSSLRSFRL